MQVSLNFTPYDTKWLPYSNKLVLLGQTPKMEGVLKFYKLHKESLKEIYSNSFGKGLKTCSWNFFGNGNDLQLAMGDIDGKLYIFDIEKQKITYQIQAHSKMLNSLDSIGGLIG